MARTMKTCGQLKPVAEGRLPAAYFSDLLGASLERVRPGEIVVARSARRDELEEGPGGVRRIVPVWVLVSGGRGVVSTTRFLLRIVEAWAEDFAAPDYLLRPEFLEDLRAGVSRAMDSQITLSRLRLFAPALAEVSGAVSAIMIQPGRDADVARALEDSRAAARTPLVCIADGDHASAHAALSAGCAECGRAVRLEAQR